MNRKEHFSDDVSVDAMLAEHERISTLYLYNREVGEKRTSVYMTIISLGAMILLGIAQFQGDATVVIEPGIVFLIGIIILGILTFQRLVERRIRAIEYLRAINRIHRYFVDEDPSLQRYYYWPSNDDFPDVDKKVIISAGLSDIIAFLNSLFSGILFVIFEFLLTPFFFHIAIIAGGIIVGVIVWFLQRAYELKHFRAAEREMFAKIRFPLTSEVD